MTDLEEVLTELGYQLFDEGKFWRTNCLFRGGDNKTALRINKFTGEWVDFVQSKRGEFKDLIGLTLGIEDPEQMEAWLQLKDIRIEKKTDAPAIKMPSKLSKEWLVNLVPDHSYWMKRGISEQILELFRGGVSKEGKLKDRYVNPIFDVRGDLVGLSGRALKRQKIKYKIIGKRAEFVYPLLYASEAIRTSKTVILTEGMGCLFSLWEAGIRNTMCLFGTDLSIPQMNALFKFDLDKIVISLNNDSRNHFVGNNAALKLFKKLNKFYDRDQLEVLLPDEKDWNETLIQKGKEKINEKFEKI